MKMRRKIISVMIILLMMECNNGGESSSPENRLNEIGKSVENAFYSFVNLEGQNASASFIRSVINFPVNIFSKLIY